MAEFEGSSCELVITENTDFPAIQDPVVAGFRIPFASASVSPKRGSVQINKIDGTQNPRPRGRGKLDVSGNISYPLHPLSCGHIFRHWVATPVVTGAKDPYQHVFTLGYATTPLPIGFQLAFQQTDASVERLYYGCRAGSLGLSIDVEGGVMFDLGLTGINVAPWGVNTIVSVTDYTEEAVDQMIGIFSLESSPVTNRFSNFKLNLNRNLATDRYGICSDGIRANLSRGVPTLDGTVDAFLDAAAVADVVAAAEGNTPLDFSVNFETVDTPEESVTIVVNNAYLQINNEGVDSDAGRNVSFNWHASGADSLVITVLNSVATYIPAP